MFKYYENGKEVRMSGNELKKIPIERVESIDVTFDFMKAIRFKAREGCVIRIKLRR